MWTMVQIAKKKKRKKKERIFFFFAAKTDGCSKFCDIVLKLYNLQSNSYDKCLTVYCMCLELCRLSYPGKEC